MRKHTLVGAAMAALLFMTTLAFAQYDSPAAGQPQAGSEQHEHGGKRHNVDEHVKKLTKELNLNQDQQKQVRSILEEQHKQMESAHQDSSMSQQDRHSKFQASREATHQKIREILTPDQQKKFDAMQEKHHDRMNKEGGEKQQ